jgi:23S rRNA pseudouridine1911/1915/1917 synthase
VHASQILFEDNHLLVLNKPADWIVQGASTDQRSLLESARLYIKNKYEKPGNVYLGVVSRLDAPVTGAVPFARTSKCAARLSEQFRSQSVSKEYWAIVSGAPQAIEARLEQTLLRRPNETITKVCSSDHPEGQLAVLEYRVVSCLKSQSFLRIRLITGRKHQIRCQLSAIGCPILGDRLDGSKEGFPQGIALHCQRLEFEHPTTKACLKVLADPPIYWPANFRNAGDESE